ncbi:MAG TPA: hypothetical protein VKF42_02075 [Chitinivibrionales bacterium]|jgi:hypothetical protein|nr:hypothetical protein [Chitinivibrionales bacterium]
MICRTKTICGVLLPSIAIVLFNGCVVYSLRDLQLTATSPVSPVNVERPNSAQSLEVGGFLGYNGGYGIHYQDGPQSTATDPTDTLAVPNNVNWSLPETKAGLLFTFNSKSPFSFTGNLNGSYYNQAFYYDFTLGVGAHLSNSIIGSRLYFTFGSRNSNYRALIFNSGNSDSLIRDNGESFCPSIGFNGTINTMKEYGWLKYFLAPNVQYFYWMYRYQQDIDVRLLWASVSAGVFKEVGPVTVVLATNLISFGVSGFLTENTSFTMLSLPEVRLQVVFGTKY